MFILSNILIILVVAIAFFLLFTLLNIHSFTNDFQTSLYLTFIFCDLFIRMPFVSINFMYSEREKILKKVRKDKNIPQHYKDHFEYLYQKKSRLFFFFYKMGLFSYNNLMRNVHHWYSTKPFTVRISFTKQKRKSFEDKYLRDLKKDLSSLDGVSIS